MTEKKLPINDCVENLLTDANNDFNEMMSELDIDTHDARIRAKNDAFLKEEIAGWKEEISKMAFDWCNVEIPPTHIQIKKVDRQFEFFI